MRHTKSTLRHTITQRHFLVDLALMAVKQPQRALGRPTLEFNVTFTIGKTHLPMLINIYLCTHVYINRKWLHNWPCYLGCTFVLLSIIETTLWAYICKTGQIACLSNCVMLPSDAASTAVWKDEEFGFTCLKSSTCLPHPAWLIAIME